MNSGRRTLAISLFLMLSLLPTLNTGGWNHCQRIWDEYGNTPPDPPYIEGPTTCNITEKMQYFITITDPDEDRLVELNVLFGDGTNETIKYRGSSCTKGWRSGMTLTVGHRWIKQDDYTIKARVKDYPRDWSDWGFLDVHVAHTKLRFKESFFLFIFDIFKERHYEQTSLISPYGHYYLGNGFI